MAHPYRVIRFTPRNGEIRCKTERYYSTEPMLQSTVFPRLQGGILSLLDVGSAFAAECELQVSERVLGFWERRGAAKPVSHNYDSASPYSQREINRFFETTGVCWYGKGVRALDAMADFVLESFCASFDVHPRDLGAGRFHSRVSPLGVGKVQGSCVYDATSGSLRLTQTLAENIVDVLGDAAERAQKTGDSATHAELAALAEALVNGELEVMAQDGGALGTRSISSETIWVVAPGELAVYLMDGVAREVKVTGVRYTPKGLYYTLASEGAVDWMVTAERVDPLAGMTRMARYNLMTGEYLADNPEAD